MRSARDSGSDPSGRKAAGFECGASQSGGAKTPHRPNPAHQISSFNAAGEALRELGLGSVRLRYREPDDLIPRDTYAVWIDGTETRGDIVGTGDTPEAALFDALAQRDRRAA